MIKITLRLLPALLPFILFAQTAISVSADAKTFSKGTYPSFTVEIPQAKLKEVEKSWIRYLNSGSVRGVKSETVNGEIIMRGAQNRNIAPDPFIVYSKLLETQEGVRLTTWMTADDSLFFSKNGNSDQDIAAQKYVRDFALEEHKNAVKNELEEEKTRLKKLENDMDGLIRDEEKSNRKISELKRSIERNKSNLQVNAGDQKTKADQILIQKTVVENSRKSSEEVQKAEERSLKILEGEKKTLEKKQEKMSKEIDGWEKDIRDEERQISKSQQDQKVKNTETEKQKKAVNAIEDKLKNIR